MTFQVFKGGREGPEEPGEYVAQCPNCKTHGWNIICDGLGNNFDKILGIECMGGGLLVRFVLETKEEAHAD